MRENDGSPRLQNEGPPNALTGVNDSLLGAIDDASKLLDTIRPTVPSETVDDWPAPASVVDIVKAEPTSVTAVYGKKDGTEVERTLSLVPASSITMRRVRWLWDPTPEDMPPTSMARIPAGTLHIIAGPPSVGKSQFEVWLIAQITQGTLPGEYLNRPRAAVIAATEDSWAMTIVPRLVAAGADLDRVFRIDVHDDEDEHARLTLPTDIGILERLARTNDLGILACDPLLSVLNGRIDDYRAVEVRKAVEPLVQLAEKADFTIVGLAHFTKTGAADPLARVAGSGAFGQIVRSVSVLSKRENDDPDDNTPRFVLSVAKNNLGREDLPSYDYAIQPITVEASDGPSYVSRFVLGEESDTSVGDQMRAANTPREDRADLTECADWLREYLINMGGEASRADIVKAAKAAGGFSDSTLNRAKRSLKIVSHRTGFGSSMITTWALP